MAFRKAERKKAKLRLGITGPAGSGKTYGALLVAFGLGGKVAMIDTENGSGDLYSGIGDYDVETISAPYEVEKYLKAIKEAEDAGYDVLIIDSLSHAWAGEGGLLDRQGKIADSGRGNGYTAWRQVTPLHNKLIDAMLTSKCHVIATMRSKTEYAQDKDEKGRTVIRKVGLAPVQRDGMEYEFGVVFDLGANHIVSVSKDRTSLFDGQTFTLSQETGAKLKAWLESGADIPVPAPQPQTTPPDPAMEAEKHRLYQGFLQVLDGAKEQVQSAMLKITEGRGWREWTAEDLKFLKLDLERMQEERKAGQHPQAANE